MDELLVDGYVRNAEKSLNGREIPSVIIHLVSSYYCMLIRFLCCHSDINNGPNIWIADINNRHPMKSTSWRTNIKSLSYGKSTVSLDKICYTTHIKIPSGIKQQISNITNECINNHKYDVLFQCGKKNRHHTNYKAILFDRKQFEASPDSATATGFKWSLPELDLYVNIIAFSREFGLLVIGETDDQKRFYKLDFNSRAYREQYEWKWKRLHNIPEHKTKHCASVTFEDKFAIVGGNSIAIYNLEEDIWRYTKCKSKYHRYDAGLLYDNVSGNIYAGGGSRVQHLSSNIEHYNMAKDMWFDELPETWMSHACYPVLWKNHSILYIASAFNDGAEYIDLRGNAQMWTRVYINNLQSLSNVFGIRYDRMIRRRNFRIVC